LFLLRVAVVFLATALLGQIAGPNEERREERRGEFGIALVNGTLRVGVDCSETEPCNARFGHTVHTVKRAATVKPVAASSGIAFIYLTPQGDVTAGSTVTLTCEGCRYARGITQFPPDAIPLFTWSIVKGVFDPKGSADFRAGLSTKNVMSGSGILTVDNAGNTTVAVDPTLVSVHVLVVPKSSSSNCATGEFSFDNEYYYVCVAPNKWKRAALSNF
jgi:hypothetical protein